MELRLCLVGKEGVGKRSIVTLYGRRSDPEFGGTLEPKRLVNSAICRVKLNNVPVLVRLDALTDWADETQRLKLNNSHRVLLTFDMSADSEFAGVLELTRLINEVTARRRTRVQYDIIGTKADLCEDANASILVAGVAPQLKTASRFAVSTARNGDSIVEAINKIILSTHAQLISEANAAGKLRPVANRRSESANASLVASYQGIATEYDERHDAFAPIARGIYPQLPVTVEQKQSASCYETCSGMLEPLVLENNPLDMDPELDHPIACPSCVQS